MTHPIVSIPCLQTEVTRSLVSEAVLVIYPRGQLLATEVYFAESNNGDLCSKNSSLTHPIVSRPCNTNCAWSGTKMFMQVAFTIGIGSIRFPYSWNGTKNLSTRLVDHRNRISSSWS